MEKKACIDCEHRVSTMAGYYNCRHIEVRQAAFSSIVGLPGSVTCSWARQDGPCGTYGKLHQTQTPTLGRAIRKLMGGG